jgi:hypothetical protein
MLRERFHEHEEIGVRYLLVSHGTDPETLNTWDLVGNSVKAIALKPGKSIEGEFVDPRLSGIKIRSAAVAIGTYQGKSDGSLKIEIAGDRWSSTGVVELKMHLITSRYASIWMGPLSLGTEKFMVTDAMKGFKR